MKTFTLLFILLTLSLAIAYACIKRNEPPATKLTVLVVDEHQKPVPDVVVNAYDRQLWSLFRDDTEYATQYATSDEDGEARFKDLNDPVRFNEENQFQNTFYFTIHYKKNGAESVRLKEITFKLGDEKTTTFVLD
jgi:hypothetical protein